MNIFATTSRYLEMINKLFSRLLFSVQTSKM